MKIDKITSEIMAAANLNSHSNKRSE